MPKRKIEGQLPLDFMLPTTTWVVPSELPDLRGSGRMLAVDTETRDDGLKNKMGAGWVYNAGWICGISMAAGDRSVYIPLRHPDTECFDFEAVRRWLSDHFKSDQEHIFQNGPYDLGWIKSEFNIDPPDKLHDTIGMAFILDENRFEYNLDALCKWQNIPGKDESGLRQAAEAFGFDPKQDLWRLPAKYVGPYAEQDAVSTLHLAEKMLPQLEAEGLMQAYQLEMDIMPLCIEMRRRGIRIDESAIDKTRIDLFSKRDLALQELKEHVLIGRDITIDDIRSPKWMAQIFNSLKIPFPQTEKGNDSFSNDWMSKSPHRAAQLCAEAAQFNDAGDKFIEQYITKYLHRGRIHSEIHQFRDDRGGTITTRFSYSDPPLQQMPSRHPIIGKMIRGLFLPEQGEIWCANDYSQQEYRLAVHFAYLSDLAGADKAVAMYREDPDTDFHQMVAELTRLPRRKAKDVNFAKIFGAGVPKFASMTGMSEEEARTVMEQYDNELPFFKRLSEMCMNVADRRGYIRMLDGARGRFDQWEAKWVDYKTVREYSDRARAEGRDLPKMTPCSYAEGMARMHDNNHPWSTARGLKRAKTHKAMNKLIQGSAARQTKMAMREMWKQGLIPMLQMHDDLNLSVSSPAPAEQAAEIMREVVTLSVPIKVDTEYGMNWGTAKYTDFNEVFKSDGSIF